MSDDDDSDPKLKALLQQLKSAPVSTEDISLECTQLLARLRQIPAEIQSDQTALASEDFSALPFQQIGQYELLERIAGGGMGEVFKARQQKLGNLVAIKLLYRDRVTDRHLLDRFEQEMRAVGRLNHENIVKPLYADEQNGVPYLVMEYVAGRTLTDLLEEYTTAGKPFPIELACESIRQAAIGLDHAHQHGIIHRDIKPSNLMLAGVSGSLSVVGGQPANGLPTTDNKPTLKILDLGLARLNDPAGDDKQPRKADLTREGQVMGTPDYMAPEQLENSRLVDARTDVYAMGATLFKLLTGRTPYADVGDGSLTAKLMAIASQPCPTVKQFRPDVPAELDTLVRQMLSKSPNDRPQTAMAVAEALRPFAYEVGRALLPVGSPGQARVPILQSRRWSSPVRLTMAVVALGLSVALGLMIRSLTWTEESETVKRPAIAKAEQKPEFALRFDGKTQFVELPFREGLASPLTFEAWVTPTSKKKGHVIWAGAPKWVTLEVHQERWLMSVVNPGHPASIAASEEPIELNQRVHVAGTWDGQQVMIYLNGKRGQIPSVPTSSWNWPAVAKCFIGRNSAEVLGFDGLVHAVRVSSNIRYQAAFSPQRRWESDEQTLAIYHFDEGSGVTLKDASGHNRHGTITNAEWLDVSPHSKQGTPETKTNLAVQDSVIRPERNPTVPAENDPERDIAEWVLQNGGQIKLLNQGNWIEKVADLPTTPLTVDYVTIRNVPDFTVADAQRLTKLRELINAGFFSTTLAPGSIKTLAGCRHLQALGVSYGATTDSTLSEVLLVPQLRAIGFTMVAVTDDVVARLGELSQLTNVGIVGCQRVTEECLVRMTAAPPPKLHSFGLGMSKISVTSLRAISGLPHLQWLALQGQQLGENGLIELARAPALSKVSLAFESGVTQAATAELQKALPSCQIWVSKSEFASPLYGPAYRDTIRQLMTRGFVVAVTTNVVGGVTWIGDDDPFPKGDVVFAESVSTKDAYDASAKLVKRVDLQLIAQLPDLRAITIGLLPPDGLRELLPLKNLNTLLTNGPLTDADIALLPSFPKLSELTATISNDTALETIAKQPHLSSLKFGTASAITDNGLKVLESARTLSTVDLGYMQISLEAAQALADARPDIIVNWRGGCLDPTVAK